MKKMMCLLPCIGLLGLTSWLTGCSSGNTGAEAAVETQAGKDAKAAFAEMSEALRAADREKAFQYISKRARREIEASGQADVSLNFLAKMSINYSETKGDVIVLGERTKSGPKGAEVITTIPVFMIREDGQWKLGPSDSISRGPETE